LHAIRDVAASQSLYVRRRGEGEPAVRAEFADALLIRLAVIFGPDDAILNTTFKAPPPVPIDPMEVHDWSCMLKEHLRHALIDQAQTGNYTAYKELTDRLGLEPPRTDQPTGRPDPERGAAGAEQRGRPQPPGRRKNSRRPAGEGAIRLGVEQEVSKRG
jgi:hypothetical protein